jgi:hypothetical protein
MPRLGTADETQLRGEQRLMLARRPGEISSPMFAHRLSSAVTSSLDLASLQYGHFILKIGMFGKRTP